LGFAEKEKIGKGKNRKGEEKTPPPWQRGLLVASSWGVVLL